MIKFLNNYYFKRALSFYFDCFIISLLVFLYLFTIDCEGPFILTKGLPKWNSKRIFTIQIIIYVIYFICCEFFFKNTIGKKLLGFHIERFKNNYFMGRIILRTFARFFILDFFLYLIFKKKRLLHEKISGIHTNPKVELF